MGLRSERNVYYDDDSDDVETKKEQSFARGALLGGLGGAALMLATLAAGGNLDSKYDALKGCEGELGPHEALVPAGSKLEDIRELTAAGVRLCHQYDDVFKIVNVETDDESSFSLTGLHQR